MKAQLTVVIEIEVSQPLSIADQHLTHDRVCDQIRQMFTPAEIVSIETEWSGEGAPE